MSKSYFNIWFPPKKYFFQELLRLNIRKQSLIFFNIGPYIEKGHSHQRYVLKRRRQQVLNILIFYFKKMCILYTKKQGVAFVNIRTWFFLDRKW